MSYPRTCHYEVEWCEPGRLCPDCAGDGQDWADERREASRGRALDAADFNERGRP